MSEYVVTGTIVNEGPIFTITTSVPEHEHGVEDLTATGTPSASTFLRGDNTWATPPGGGEGGTSDHGALTGLSDDDHPQYLNNARGDARYDALGAAAAAQAASAPVGHNHAGVYATAAHNHDGTYATAAHNHSGVYEPAGAVSTHAAATDPHGDRAYADGLLAGLTGNDGSTVSALEWGLVGDGVTDCTVAFQAMFDELGDPGTAAGGIRGAAITLPPGEYVISDTVNIWRFAGSLRGAGVGNDPTLTTNYNPGQGTVIRWNGAAGVPMFRVRDSQHFTISDIRFGGKEGAAPSAALNFDWQTGDTIGTNAEIHVEHCHFGYWPWTYVGSAYPSKTVVSLATGIHFTGTQNNDQFRIRNCTFSGAGHTVGEGGTGRLSGERGILIDCVQSIWGSVHDCTFARMEYGIDTVANISLWNAQFDYCGTDIWARGTANVDVTGWQSERQGCFAKVAPEASLTSSKGLIQASAELVANGVLIDAFPSDRGQRVVLRDMKIDWPGYVKPDTVPVIQFGPETPYTCLKGGHRLEVVNCWGMYPEAIQQPSPGYIYQGGGSYSKGTIVWDNECTDGHFRFRNQMLNEDAPGGGRETLDKTIWELPQSYAATSHNHDGTYATASHDHAGVYATAAHDHDADYSAIGHDHAGVYATAAHNHDGTYATAAHNHDATYAALVHKSRHATGGADALSPADIGAVTAVTSGAKLWIGTQAAYDAIGSKDSSTVYVVEG